jgi:hypothetical protein
MKVGEYKKMRLQKLIQSKKPKTNPKIEIEETPIQKIIEGARLFELRNIQRENTAKLRLLEHKKNQR